MDQRAGMLVFERVLRAKPVWYQPILLLPLFLLVTAPPASADWFAVLVEYECDQLNDRVSVKYRGAYNEDGEAMLANKGPDAWSPWSLVTIEDGEWIRDPRTVTRTCGLSSGSYEVTIGPLPGNGNVTRRCGASMSAWTEIRRGTKTLGRYEFEDDCHSSRDIITEVTIRAENPDWPEITSVSKHEFFR